LKRLDAFGRQAAFGLQNFQKLDDVRQAAFEMQELQSLVAARQAQELQSLVTA
jgi:hypothetical protein